MEIVVKENNNKDWKKFPKIMKRDTGEVVFFLKKGTGVVLEGGTIFAEGHFILEWEMSLFKEWSGEVLIKQ